LHPGTRIAALTTDAETASKDITSGWLDAAWPGQLRFRIHSTRQEYIGISGVVVAMEVSVPPGSNSTMQIYGPYRVSTTQTNPATQRSQPAKPADVAPKSSAAPVDQLDLSRSADVNRLGVTNQVAGGGEIRIDRVAELRRQIADGSYETPEKLDAALDRLLDQLA
jgi:anti-sigma28 factor (negative regulator of flagellin synthesis)